MNQNQTHNSKIYFCLSYLLFFIISFVYFGFIGDYILFFQEKNSLFIFSTDFLRENFHQPGGLLIYFGKFLSTFFYYPIAGAAIVAIILTLIIFVISKIISYLAGKTDIYIALIIGISLFYLHTDYRFLLFNSLGILIQISLFYLSIKYITLIKGWIPILFIPLLYLFTGGFSWIFALMLTIYYVFRKDNIKWAKIIGLWVLSLVTFILSKEFLFFQSDVTLLLFPFSELSTGSQQILFLSIVGIISILPAIASISFSLPQKLKFSEVSVWILTTIVLSIFQVVLAFKRYDLKDSRYFYVEKLFYQNKFDDVIRYNTTNPPTNLLTIFLNNIALSETNKLNDLLFSFPQNPDGSTLFLKWEMVGEILKRGGYFYYTIGMINEAHRWAFENMVMKGLTPEGLEMLIRTELIYGNYEVASKYIAVLKQTLFYTDEAKVFEKLLFNDVAVNSDNDLGEKRKEMIKSDFFTITDDPYINIERIMDKDSINKKAFEYKVAFMLLKKDFRGIANALPQFDRYGYTTLPVHVEEAALALSVMNKGILPNLGKMKISKNTEFRWDQYLTIFQQYKTDPRSAEPALRKQFGNTFWYHAFYR